MGQLSTRSQEKADRHNQDGS